MAISRPYIQTSGQTKYFFLQFDGVIEPMGESVERIVRPGIDGVAGRLRGQKAQPTFHRSVVDVFDGPAANELYKTFRRMNGTLVTMFDVRQVTHENILVLNVRQARTQEIFQAVGGIETDPGALLMCVWTLQATELNPEHA